MTDSAAYVIEFTRKGKLYRQTAGSWRQVLQFAEEELKDGAEFVGITCPGGELPHEKPARVTTANLDLFRDEVRATCAQRGGLQSWR